MRWRLNLAVRGGGPVVESSVVAVRRPFAGQCAARLIGTAGQNLGMCRGKREKKACPGVLGLITEWNEPRLTL